MNNRRSYLDSINAGRRRRPSTSLEELSDTLDEIESRIGRHDEDRRGGPRLRGHTRRLSAETAYHDGYDASQRERPFRSPARDATPGRQGTRSHRDDRGVTEELGALREELRHQMGAGLRSEFSRLREDIDTALRTSAPASQVAELGVEFERLAAMIHKLAHKTDDRQLNILRLEMAEVKNALGKLAREESIQSFDRRWEELDRRWSDIASQVSQAERGRANDPALHALGARLEQINDVVCTLPNSLALHALEAEMKALAATVDKIAHRQDRIAPETLAMIEDRLDDIARTVAAAAVPAPPSTFDPAPFERIEARISMLARQLDEVAEEIPPTGLVDQLAMLSNRVEDIAHRVDLPGDTIDRLARQLETISRKLDDAPSPPDMDEVFRGLEDRFISLSNMLERRQDDALAQGQSLFRDLENRLEQVASRLEPGDDLAPSHEAQLIEVMDLRFAELASRLEQQQPAPSDDRAIRELEARLDTISSHIEANASRSAVDPELIRSLEAQIAGLTAHISQPSAAEADTLSPRLDKIERSIEESGRDVVEAARLAAEDAVRSFAGSSGDNLLVAGLVEDLKSLETLTRKSDDRNARTFEAIHDTLLKIVDRLGAVEAGALHNGGAHVATNARDTLLGVEETPSLAAISDAVPLDAGTMDDDANLKPDGSPRTARRTPASAAARAAADAVREETQVAQAETGSRLWKLGGLTRALSGRGGKSERPAADEPVAAIDVTESIAPTVEVDTPLDPELANRPLEPGSGAPDLNAIMKRVRDERGQPARGPETDAAKADFIAAARRAAQAAAAEAEVMKRSPQEKPKSGKITVLFGNKRKPVLMGVAAVLIALAALQFGRSWTGGREVAQDPEPAAVETVEAITLPETAAEASESEPVRVAGETARSVMAMAPETPEDVTTDWLDAGAAMPAETAAAEPATEEITEIAAVPEATEEMVAAIPVEAGPAALREAAAAGDPKALFEIGNRYADGRGVTEDLAQAADWYRKAAEQGLAPAQYRLGNMYEKGIGLERDVAQAKSWYQLAAEQGNASAMHNLAVLHAMGADDAADNAVAARWFERAAELGVKDSQFNLGILAAKGVGMPQNLEEAYKWFALVAKTGDRDAAEKRDEIAKALRPEQLENARAAAELWRAKTIDSETNSVEIPESWSESTETTASVDMKQAVRNIQFILNKSGYDAGSEDGVMGQKTKTAIAAFQKDNGMTATGEVDEALVRALLERR